MPMQNAMTTDPLRKFKEGVRAGAKGVEKPVPLTATDIAVRIDGGVAVVTTARTFRNVESGVIEATMTFPVPTDAVLFSLTAAIDGRTVRAECRPKAGARETYEGAIDAGKAAILHEELLKGVHMLSVGRIKPGDDVVVTGIWAAPLSFVGERPALRIPTTVGDIFGRQPLLDSDALVAGDCRHGAKVRIECANGAATLVGGKKNGDGEFEVDLDAPIEVVVSGWKPKAVHGVAADGRKVTLSVAPVVKADGRLDIDFMVDRSGSMNEAVSGSAHLRRSKHHAALAGLLAYAKERVKDADRIRVWEFNGEADLVGVAEGSRAVSDLFRRLRPPLGGTELGRAFDDVAASEGSANVVLLTDGKTWAFDPQKYARTGIRVTAVLIGEDSLEGGVAHLAGMTGGQIVVPVGDDIDAAIAAAFDAARLPFAAVAGMEGQPKEIAVHRRGAEVTAVWGGKAKKVDVGSEMARAVGSLAASLAIPAMAEDEACRLAVAEGIVCHLTSLVMVDEEGDVTEGIPATRKVELTRPRTAMLRSAGPLLASGGADVRSMAFASMVPRGGGLLFRGGPDVASVQDYDGFGNIDAWLAEDRMNTRDPAGIVPALPKFVDVDGIDWDAAPDALRGGDLSMLPSGIAEGIRKAAALPAIMTAAARAGMDPVVYVVGLLARHAAASSRTAGRIAKAVLRGAAEADAAMSAVAIGL